MLDAQARRVFDVSNREAQEKLRALYAARQEKPLLDYAAARANAPVIEWRQEDLPQPQFTGIRTLDPLDLTEISNYIDWTFFFSAWELKGRFPAIFDDPRVGEEAKKLYRDGVDLLEQLLSDGQLQGRAVYGFWPAASAGDDLVLWEDASHSSEVARFPMLREQAISPSGGPNRCLADFVAPQGLGLSDHVGAFAVTAGLGADAIADRYARDHDDYQAILVKALADRLAEASAEWLHARVRREWGYETESTLSSEELIAEKYRGIRPAFGYPACPDHSSKATLFALLQAEHLGMSLTENYAVQPAASVSGIYFAHPEARYFNLGRIGRDQVADYAQRCGVSTSESERWLSPNLGYEPEPRIGDSPST